MSEIIVTPAPAGRVLIVDDHPIVLYGLRATLERHGGFALCGEASNSDAARAETAALRPDYIVLDLVMGGRDGVALVRDLTSLAPDARILVYSSQNETNYARRVLAAGASGFVAKSEPLEVVAGALEVLSRGETFIGEDLRRQLLEDFISAPDKESGHTLHAFSDREKQILRLIGEGLALREIAVELGISVKTVGTYRDRLKAKIVLDRSSDLVYWARNHLLHG